MQLVHVGALQRAVMLQAFFAVFVEVFKCGQRHAALTHHVCVYVMKPTALDGDILLHPALVEQRLQNKVPMVVGVVFLQVVLKEVFEVHGACPRCAIALRPEA